MTHDNLRGKVSLLYIMWAHTDLWAGFTGDTNNSYFFDVIYIGNCDIDIEK